MTSYLSLLEPSRLCAICDMALKSHILCASQPHHKSGLDLEKASDLGCYICGTIRHSKTCLRRSEECRLSSFELQLAVAGHFSFGETPTLLLLPFPTSLVPRPKIQTSSDLPRTGLTLVAKLMLNAEEAAQITGQQD
ncbi:uncharacterized protein FPRN_11607 [Fusarium proliferatum]|nr:uncharacterized protein FPRN_11607 [Fusarium proliferatum]